MRQLISDTATVMFLEQGFDEVTVADIASACDVSEKTVFNYFPTKESLVLDREQDMAERMRATLGPGSSQNPVEAAVAWLTADIDDWITADLQDQSSQDLILVRRFVELIEFTPALKAAWQQMMERLTDIAAEAMAARAGVDPDDPEPRIAAVALLGLGDVRMRATLRYIDGNHTAAEARELVIAEVRRAARLIDVGLWSFGAVVQGTDTKAQLKAAADSAKEAHTQVMAALHQARASFRQLKAAADAHHPGHLEERQRKAIAAELDADQVRQFRSALRQTGSFRSDSRDRRGPEAHGR